MKINRCRVCGKMPGFVGFKKQSGIIYHRVACGNCGHCATSPLAKSVEEAIIRWNKENEVKDES